MRLPFDEVFCDKQALLLLFLLYLLSLFRSALSSSLRNKTSFAELQNEPQIVKALETNFATITTNFLKLK